MVVNYYRFCPPIVMLEPVIDDFGNVLSTIEDFPSITPSHWAFTAAFDFAETAGAQPYSDGGVH